MVQVRMLRKIKGLRQTDLAKAANISQPHVAKIESGQLKPSVRVAKRLAAVLDIDWTEFFKESA